ncbi:hypothetical protein CDD81_837 [Ophiocordyceps australis]|uniref:Uncharacterized protein n=1 Tax=Ophiocordyceps australis TaxID=1399860 RepID=A0A2C5XUS4_9HYPO|nr:hypothetical protein CDD81_837 [Ophiocordyceps australis]
MADTSSPAAPPVDKHPRTIPGLRVQKRPLLRRPAPASALTPLVYISSCTPFMSAARRISKLLARSQHSGAACKRATLQERIEQISSEQSGKTRVTAVGAGRAVEKMVALAAWFERQGGYLVELRTSTSAAVDDVINKEGDEEDAARVRMDSVVVRFYSRGLDDEDYFFSWISLNASRYRMLMQLQTPCQIKFD